METAHINYQAVGGPQYVNLQQGNVCVCEQFVFLCVVVLMERLVFMARHRRTGC